MQVLSSQVIVQLSSSAAAGGSGPVFSVSSAPGAAEGRGGVQISAAARALAEVSRTGTRPQLNLMVQMLGSMGPGASRSFEPFSPAVAAAERFAAVSEPDAGQEARSEAAEDAIEQRAALQQSPTATAAVPASVAAGPGPNAVATVTAYQQAAAASAAPAAAPTVDVNA